MLNFTPLTRPYFACLDRSTVKAAMAMEATQRATQRELSREGAKTRWGAAHGITPGMTWEEWRHRVPLTSYEDLRPEVMKMISGERDILWPGVTKRFAQSSGTSGGKSKFIPITRRGLACSHYRGGKAVVARYLSLYPQSRLFAGRALILGGSFANSLEDVPRGVAAGDLSAHLIDCINPLGAAMRVPSKETALMADWREKLPRLVAEVSRRDVTNLSGVPSWMMTVLKEVLRQTGASTIADVWPNLEVFFHGGISFEPYREEYRRLVGNPSMRYLETYNASEGFFAVQWQRDSRAMLLLPDVDTFYEFIPVAHTLEEQPSTLPAWEVEPGREYELVITSSNGLWRYRLGDTVRVESIEPLTITIAGRTQQYINAFGEELMVHNAERAMTQACRLTGASVANFTAAPVYATEQSLGRHEWLVEWEREPVGGVEAFADALDRELRNVNGDYDAKRSGNIFLDGPLVVTMPVGAFDRWLESTGKLGGQRKVPRLCPDRRYVDAIKKLNN